jgi:hypothetical protein
MIGDAAYIAKQKMNLSLELDRWSESSSRIYNILARKRQRNKQYEDFERREP